MTNVFSIDLEEWFCSHNLQERIQYQDWEYLESRVEQNTYFLLDLLDEFEVKATFFVLGWIATHYPKLVKDVAKRGHEVASHGYAHQLVFDLKPTIFDEDIGHSIAILEDLTGLPVNTYRAPAFSITKKNLWALDVLEKNGIQIDSSVYPLTYHPDYGMSDSPLLPYQITDNLLEIPLSCVTYGQYKIPCSGGGYFRILPYWLYRKMIKRLHQQGRSLIFYFHPWEIDTETPSIKLSRKAAFRHYTNLGTTKDKLRLLLSEFKFSTLSDFISNYKNNKEAI